MSEAEVSQFLCVLIKMGEALQNSGAEVFRVEDTLNRIAAAYGAEEVNIFVITSSIVVTLTMPACRPRPRPAACARALATTCWSWNSSMP